MSDRYCVYNGKKYKIKKKNDKYIITSKKVLKSYCVLPEISLKVHPKVNRVRNWRRCCRRLAQGLFELERKTGNYRRKQYFRWC